MLYSSYHHQIHSNHLEGLIERESTSLLVWEMKNVLAFVAGIMIMIVALRELFPEARRHCKVGKSALVATSSTILGMVVMLASDAVLEA